jgi:DNA-binding transcriptional MocR family regulator
VTDGAGWSCLLRWRNAVRDDPRLSSIAKHVALNLSTYMRADGSCFPSVRRQALDTGRDRRTVQKALRELEEHGAMSSDPGGGRRNTTAYYANLCLSDWTEAQNEKSGDTPPLEVETWLDPETAAEMLKTAAVVPETAAVVKGNGGDTPPEVDSEGVQEILHQHRRPASGEVAAVEVGHDKQRELEQEHVAPGDYTRWLNANSDRLLRDVPGRRARGR